MKEEVIFRMESAYREDFEVKSYHFGGPEKTMCIIGNMRGNEIQQLYIAGQEERTDPTLPADWDVIKPEKE